MPVTPSDADTNALAAAPAPAIFGGSLSRAPSRPAPPRPPPRFAGALGRALGRAGAWLGEVRHFARAEQISTGGLLTWRQNSLGAGGIVDANIYKLDALIKQRVDWAGEERIDAALEREADAIGWGGERRFADMHGIGQYPPFHYLPAVAGIWAGKALGLSIADTLVVSRLFNGA